MTTYLPWATSGVSALARTGAGTTNRPHIRVGIDVASTADAIQTVAPTLRILGPGDVLGFPPAHILRTDPPDGATAVDTTVFVSVDLDLATLPWLITPTQPTGARAMPWICLVVVENRDGVTLDTASSRLTIAAPADPAVELPDLAEAWAWAHVQYSGDLPAVDPASVLNDPTRTVARLLSSRVLQTDRTYLACIVPTWESGRLVGLGGSPDPDADAAPAWATPPADTVTLPVYHHMTFTTGEGGDFLSLATLIADAPPWQGAVGARAGILSLAWTDGTGAAQSAQVPVPAVLAMPGATSTSTNAEGAQAWLAGRLLPATATDTQRIDLAPPIYGAVQAGFDWTVPGATLASAPGWLQTLVSDARLRVAAGWGAAVVTQRAEDLVASAFDQLGPTGTTQALQSRAQLARGVSQRQVAQHVTGDALTVAQLIAPQSARIPTTSGDLATGLADTDVTASARTSAAYRRITRRVAPAFVKPGSGLDAFGAAVRTALDPAITVPARIYGEHLALSATAAARLATANDPLRPAVAAVSFNTAMLGPLLAINPQAVLPGADTIPVNTAALLAQDAEVVAAYLVGLNHGIQRLLQWREVPAEPRGTPFRQFWSTSYDIGDIADWDPKVPLAQQVPAHSVLALRTDLFRRYPRTAVYALPAQSGSPAFVFDPAAIVEPRFSVVIPPDLRLLGFDQTAAQLCGDPGYYIVFQEQVSETRFGTDQLTGAAPPAGSHWTVAALGTADPSGGGVPASSAVVANLTSMPPAFVAVHASRFLPVPS